MPAWVHILLSHRPSTARSQAKLCEGYKEADEPAADASVPVWFAASAIKRGVIRKVAAYLSWAVHEPQFKTATIINKVPRPLLLVVVVVVVLMVLVCCSDA